VLRRAPQFKTFWKTAEFQQIVYNEYLPLVLGPDAMFSYELQVTNESQYDPNAEPTIVNSFATAAYRFGHTLVDGVFQLIQTNGAPAGSFNLRDNMLSSGLTQVKPNT